MPPTHRSVRNGPLVPSRDCVTVLRDGGCTGPTATLAGTSSTTCRPRLASSLCWKPSTTRGARFTDSFPSLLTLHHRRPALISRITPYPTGFSTSGPGNPRGRRPSVQRARSAGLLLLFRPGGAAATTQRHARLRQHPVDEAVGPPGRLRKRPNAGALLVLFPQLRSELVPGVTGDAAALFQLSHPE